MQIILLKIIIIVSWNQNCQKNCRNSHPDLYGCWF